MTPSEFITKGRRRIRKQIIQRMRTSAIYPSLYGSYWHSRLKRNVAPVPGTSAYFTAVPNVGAGIGHQMANWIAGYWFARQFGLNFAHTPFSSPKWEVLLGLGENEKSVQELVAKEGYRTIRLPLFDEQNPAEVDRVQRIIASYGDSKVIFVAEQDQFYRDQFGVIEDLQRKFHSAPARQSDTLSFSRDNLNIAIHIRRGDIVIGQENGNANLQMRWQDNSYFLKVLTNVVDAIQTDRPIAIYVFSQGVREDYEEFAAFPNVHFCLDMGPQDSFLHMAKADLLITSKSSFSYKPALLNRGIKVCPRDFWHGYPALPEWILAEEDGMFDPHLLKNIR